MPQVIVWYFVTLLLSWLSFPLGWKVFRALPSKGYFLLRPLGLLLWGFVFWILTSLKLLSNDLPGQITALILLLAVNLLIARKEGFRNYRDWIRKNIRTILAGELLFLVAFGAWAFIRANNPEIVNTEKFMELGFINAILRSPEFPPNDPWLSGYGISYYYFGYLMGAMLIRITGVASSVGYNLISAMWFGLTAVGSYGILFDLLASRKKNGAATSELSQTPQWIYGAALLAPLMLLIVSNWFGLLDLLHSRGLFWTLSSDGTQTSTFWQNLKIPELVKPPGAWSWWPQRGGWSWWQGSRVLQDFQLNGNSVEIIDEFPFFTYLLADIHPHLLSMPFVLSAIGQALNALLGGWEGNTRLGRWEIPFGRIPILLAVLTLGGIAFLNTWDFPFYLLLIAAALVYRQYSKFGWSGKRVEEFLLYCISGGILSILLYLPFYLSFSSQAGGILPSLVFFSRGTYFWIMFGPLLVPVFGYLIYKFVKNRAGKSIGKALLITLALFAFLFVFSWALSFVATRLPELNQLFYGVQGATTDSNLLVDAFLLRLKSPGTLISLLILFVLSLSLLLQKNIPISVDIVPANQSAGESKKDFAHIFVILLILLGGILTLVPEFVYLRDQFGNRMNTIFKFYFQAWIVWSIAGSYALIYLFKSKDRVLKADKIFIGIIATLGVAAFVLGVNRNQPGLLSLTSGLQGLGSSPWDYLILAIPAVFLVWLGWSLFRRRWKHALAVLAVAGLAAGLIYPVLELWNKTQGFSPAGGLTLDGSEYFRASVPDQMAATDWLSKAPIGVMVEAVSPTGGSYTTYNGVSTFSGMPSVLGWIGHEAQWRGGYEEIGTRQADIDQLYTTSDWATAQVILNKYNIRYVYLGPYEYQTYAVNENKFAEHLQLVFEAPNAKIYEWMPISLP